ncbi:MAG: MFS transporter, partial [Thermoanaerobaculia bacterium]
IFQRPAQLGVSFYKDVGALEAMAACARCGLDYAPLIQINDLIDVEHDLGYRYEMSSAGVDHYQRICPACRRKMLALAQGELWHAEGRT